MINRFPNKPLIYNVAWKTVIYWLMATLIHYVERLIDFWRQLAALLRAIESCWRKSFGRISGLSRSFCSSSLPCIARCTNWCASWEGKSDEDILRSDACTGSVFSESLRNRHKTKKVKNNENQTYNKIS